MNELILKMFISAAAIFIIAAISTAGLMANAEMHKTVKKKKK